MAFSCACRQVRALRAELWPKAGEQSGLYTIAKAPDRVTRVFASKHVRAQNIFHLGGHPSERPRNSDKLRPCIHAMNSREKQPSDSTLQSANRV